jgi:hypothetical protein
MTMTDPSDALRDATTRSDGRGQIQRDCIAASAESGRQAREALAKAANVLADTVSPIGHRPDTELARAWAEIAHGWASLSHAEATRGIAASTLGTDQQGVNT